MDIKSISTDDLVQELIRREVAEVVISLRLYDMADIHCTGPLTVLQLHGDWSDKF